MLSKEFIKAGVVGMLAGLASGSLTAAELATLSWVVGKIGLQVASVENKFRKELTSDPSRHVAYIVEAKRKVSPSKWWQVWR